MSRLGCSSAKISSSRPRRRLHHWLKLVRSAPANARMHRLAERLNRVVVQIQRTAPQESADAAPKYSDPQQTLLLCRH